MVNSEV
jgi:hypothetical protein